jgi:cyclopropane-fatty-acyl-phospholipid synthase
MKATIRSVEKRFSEKSDSAPFCGAARKILFSILKRLKRGQIHFLEADLHLTFGKITEDKSLEASVSVFHPGFYNRIVFGGSVGAGEAYMMGLWATDDLTTLFRIFLLNQELFEGLDKRWSRLAAPAYKIVHALRRDTRKGSLSNISAHYDLGNDFYQLFLDETLTYSCGIFEKKTSTMKEASLAKYDRICRKLALKSSDTVLEIGTGWGGFAIFAAGQYGCHVTTTTISNEQYRLAQERIERAGLRDRIHVLFEDYRDLKGRFDKLASIEMIEAVGHQYLGTFFRKCSDCLKEDGMMLLQAITIADRVFEKHKNTVDFIKRYIFPGSCIPSIAAMSRAVARGTDLKIDHLEDITPNYPRTLRAWRSRFFENIEQVKALGYPNAFIRMWEFYLCYCEAGFQERYLGDVQMRLIKPMCRQAPILPHLGDEKQSSFMVS